MKVVKAIKKIAALGVGMSMIGATMLGAMAADLSNYPGSFIKNGQFDGVIVVGDKAAAEDVVGSIDIATSLQFALGQPLAAPTQPGGQGGAVSISGDAVSISEPNDMLEIQEAIGQVKEVLTEFDLAGLQGGTIVTDKGSTDYNQYLRFQTFQDKTNADYIDSGAIVFEEDEDDVVGDYLKFVDGNTMFQYELEFEEGVKSDVNFRSGTSGTKILNDLEDEELNILGKVFSVVNTEIQTDITTPVIALELLGGDVLDTLEEGETRTYTIDGKEYEVTLVIVSDNRESAKFSVNGEITDELKDGDTDVLRDGTEIGIRDLLPNEANEETGGDIVEFFLGANKVRITDSNFTDDTFVPGGVKVHEEDIEDSRVKIKGTYTNSSDTFELQSIQYKLKSDAPKGDLFIAPGHGLREYLDEPEGMLSDDWDIRYEGLMDTGVSIVRFNSKGDNGYDLQFTNREGLEYDIPFIDNSGDTETTSPKYGDDNDDLIFVEGNINETNVGFGQTNGIGLELEGINGFFRSLSGVGNQSMPNSDTCGNWFNVDEGDYFVLTDAGGIGYGQGDETSFTHILSYESVDTSNRKITFQDDATGQRQLSYITTNLANTCILGRASTLIVGGNTYTVYVSDGENQAGAASSSKFPLAIDQNADSRIDAMMVDVVVNGGGILRLGGVNVTKVFNDSGGVVGNLSGGTGGFAEQGWQFPFSDGASTSLGDLNESKLRELQRSWRNSTNISGGIGESFFRFYSINFSTGVNFSVSLTTRATEFDGSGLMGAGSAGRSADEVVFLSLFANTGNKVNLVVPSPQMFQDTANKTVLGNKQNLLKMQTLDEEDLIQGLTTYGGFFEQTDESSTNDANDLTIEYPLSQRGADVFVTIGSTQTSRVGPTQGGAVVVNPITVGSAKLSSEVAGQETSQNIVAVGGPCINSVAAKWMGSDTPLCGAESGLEEGSAVIKLYEHAGGKMGLLVAGWSAADTRRATKVLAEYSSYADKLVGKEVVVQPGTASGEIMVSAPQP
ncbi:MAG: S-layer protein [Candidatus Woesearchaeota archaeon]|nr:S-layer protein [Candidatus Woesearchaeota archaeon]